MKKRIFAMMLCASMFVATAGCSNAETPSASAEAGISEGTVTEAGTTGGSSEDGVFTVALDSDIDSFDPAQANAYGTELVVNNVYDTVLAFDIETSELISNLAEYEQTDDTTYVLTIKDGITFWDGNPVTAEDVAYSLKRHMDDSVASLFMYMYASVDTIEATGDKQVTIKLLNKDYDFIYTLATMAGSVVEKAVVEADASYGTPAGSVMGSGPYKLESWTEGSSIVLTKNENYWKDVTYPEDKIEFDVIADTATTAMALSSGQVDFYNLPTLDMMDQFKDSNAVEVSYNKGLMNAYLAYNCSYGPFSDPNVRKAATCAIDKEAIAKATRGEGFYETAKGMDYNPDALSYYKDEWNAFNDSLDAYSYDVERAKEYLAASAYPDGFECTMPTCAMEDRIMQAVQYYLGQIGIKVNLETVSISDFYMYAYGAMMNDEGYRDYDAIAFAWFPDFPDPTSYVLIYYGENAGVGGSNLSAYVNPKLDELYLLAKSQEGEERSKTLMEAFKIINEDCTAAIINYNGASAAINSSYDVTMPVMWFYNFDFTQVVKK